jgi:hypothetical protein
LLHFHRQPPLLRPGLKVRSNEICRFPCMPLTHRPYPRVVAAPYCFIAHNKTISHSSEKDFVILLLHDALVFMLHCRHNEEAFAHCVLQSLNTNAIHNPRLDVISAATRDQKLCSSTPHQGPNVTLVFWCSTFSARFDPRILSHKSFSAPPKERYVTELLERAILTLSF